MRKLICQIKDYIQPFERQLALNELAVLTGAKPVPLDAGVDTALRFKVKTDANVASLVSELSYWHAVGDRKQEVTRQLRGEATSVIARNGVALHDLPAVVSKIIDVNLPNRRCLRYATHGLHEYRGKFFPQLVRAFINMASVPKDGLVVDPMCGSGTTLVETVLAGRRAYGLDMNPLSVFVSSVKCKALSIDPKALISAFEVLNTQLQKRVAVRRSPGPFAAFERADQDYLRKWFAGSVLDELDRVQAAIASLRPVSVRDFYRLCLSNILRGVSWQKEDDLRVRKEVSRLPKGKVIACFLDEARRSTKVVVAFIVHRGPENLGQHTIHEADARLSATALQSLKGAVDAIITSPPYATALPYLDTDRLSLIYLGLLRRSEHRSRDTLMIGNREVTERTRRSYWEMYLAQRRELPANTQAIIEKIDELNSRGTVGFRRRNLAALLAKYFFDMQSVLRVQHELLKPGGTMFVVIGNNRTTAGGKDIEIRTTDHLAEIAQAAGFRLAGNLAMEMLTSRDIFRKNAMASEQILTLQKDQ